MSALPKFDALACCARPAVANFDFDHAPNGFNSHPFIRMTNRVCNACGAHWFGAPGDVTRYSRAEWDARINEPEAA